MRIFNDFLRSDDLSSLTNLASSAKKSPYLRTNLGSWKSDIVQYSNPVLIYDIPEKYTANLRRYPEMEDATAFMLYFWTDGSYIPWHNDDHASKTGTIYLNTEWERDWGGYLCWDNTFMIPTYNTLALQIDKDWHCTTPVTRPFYKLSQGAHVMAGQTHVIEIMRTTLQFFRLEEE